jgi:hypothetical protein
MLLQMFLPWIPALSRGDNGTIDMLLQHCFRRLKSDQFCQIGLAADLFVGHDLFKIRFVKQRGRE